MTITNQYLIFNNILTLTRLKVNQEYFDIKATIKHFYFIQLKLESSRWYFGFYWGCCFWAVQMEYVSICIHVYVPNDKIITSFHCN